jgi:hypothetical protein
MERLREEILQAQKIRSDLLKWKLALVGAIGAAGFGFGGANTDADSHPELVLCTVPLVCVYVDLLCLHLSMRIVVIGTFLRSKVSGHLTEDKAVAEYETFVESTRHLTLKREDGPDEPAPSGGEASAFALEDWAVTWSTIVLSGAVFGYGIAASDTAIQVAFIVSGAVGLAAAFSAYALYDRRFAAVRKLVPFSHDNVPTTGQAIPEGHRES